MYLIIDIMCGISLGFVLASAGLYINKPKFWIILALYTLHGILTRG